MTLTQLPPSVPAARAVQDALGALVQAVDAAKAAGCTIPPIVALGVTNVGVGLLTIAGSEAAAKGQDSPFADLHGPAILASITPSEIPASFGGPKAAPATYDGITVACSYPEDYPREQQRGHALCAGCRCGCHQ